MAEYVERETLLKQLETAFDREGKKADECAERNLPDCAVKYGHGQYCYLVAKTMVQDEPAADVAEVRHGEWIIKTDYKMPLSHAYIRKEKLYICPYCGKAYRQNMNFCGNCGAKMDGKGDAE